MALEQAPRPRTASRLFAVAIASAVTAGGTYVIAVQTGAGQLMGELMLGGRPPSLEDVTAAERVLDLVTRSSLAIGTISIVVIALLIERPRLAAVAALTVIGANVTSQALKLTILDRSDLLDGMFYALPNSFPSGHVTAAASLAVALVLVLPPLLRSAAVIAAALIVAVVAVSTLLTGWHRMADALGGVYVATAWGAGLGSVLAWRRGVERVGRRTASLGRISANVALLIGAALAALALLGYLVALADPLDVLMVLAERGGSPALFIVGAMITVGGSLVAFGALGLALRDARLDPPPSRSTRMQGGRPAPARSDGDESAPGEAGSTDRPAGSALVSRSDPVGHGASKGRGRSSGESVLTGTSRHGDRSSRGT